MHTMTLTAMSEKESRLRRLRTGTLAVFSSGSMP